MHHSQSKVDRRSPAPKPSFEVLDPSALTMGELALWQSLVQRSGGSVQTRPEWVRTWLEHHANDCDQALLVCHRGQHWVGVLPMVIHCLRLGGQTIRLARIAGTFRTPNVIRPAILSDSIELMLNFAADWAIGQQGCDGLVLSGTSARAQIGALIEGNVLEAHAEVGRIWSLPRLGEQVLSFGDDDRAFLAGLSKNMRASYRKNRKRLEVMGRVEHRVDRLPLDAVGAFHRFRGLHETDWNSRGWLGHFGDWPRSTYFHHQLVARLSSADCIRLGSVEVDGERVASQYAWVNGTMAHCQLAARDPDSKWTKCGLGTVSLIEFLQNLKDEGIQEVDLGAADPEYKARLGAVQEMADHVLVCSARRASLSRIRRFMRVSAMLQRWYYRGWVHQIRPRLRIPPYPLWRSWVDTRW